MHTAARALVCALLAAACDAPPAQLDGDAGPVWGDDAALELDAGTDAGGLEADAGRPVARDAGRDAGRVEPVDAGRAELDAGAPDAGPVTCTLVPQSGCPDGMACRQHVGPTGALEGPPECEPAGTDDEGWRCEVYDGGGDSCLPGLWCDGLTCLRSCRNDGDCPTRNGHEQRCTGGLAKYCGIVN